MATNDLESSRKTYGGFITAVKWSVPIIAVITLIIVILIAD